jgi:hypothetical protein
MHDMKYPTLSSGLQQKYLNSYDRSIICRTLEGLEFALLTHAIDALSPLVPRIHPFAPPCVNLSEKWRFLHQIKELSTTEKS